MFVFLFVLFCLPVKLLNDKVCERHFAIKSSEYGNDLKLTKFILHGHVQRREMMKKL